MLYYTAVPQNLCCTSDLNVKAPGSGSSVAVTPQPPLLPHCLCGSGSELTAWSNYAAQAASLPGWDRCGRNRPLDGVYCQGSSAIAYGSVLTVILSCGGFAAEASGLLEHPANNGWAGYRVSYPTAIFIFLFVFFFGHDGLAVSLVFPILLRAPRSASDLVLLETLVCGPTSARRFFFFLEDGVLLAGCAISQLLSLHLG